MNRVARASVSGLIALVLALPLGIGARLAVAQPTFGPKKPPATKPEDGNGAPTEKPKRPTPAKPARAPGAGAPGTSQVPEEWLQDDAPRAEPSQDGKPGEWYCWKTTDGTRYAWSLPAKYEKGKAYDLVVLLHPAQMDFRWGPSNHQRGEDGFRPDCVVVSVDGMSANPRRPDMRTFEPTAENCVRFRDVLLEFSRVLPVRHMILYGQGSGGKFAAYFSSAFPALADGVLNHGGGMVDGGAVKSTVPMVFMHGAKDSITPLRASVEAVKAYQDAGHKSVRLRVLREYNDFPNETCAGECVDYLRAMRTENPAEVVAAAKRMLTPKGADEFGYRPTPWFAGAMGVLRRFGDGEGAGVGVGKFEKEPAAEVKKEAEVLIAKIEKEAELNVTNIRTLLKASGMEKGDFELDGGAWLGYLLTARDDFRGVKAMEALAAELKLDEKIAAHAEQAGELWATWSVSAQEGEKYAIAVEKITKSYLCEGLPVDLLPRCRAIMKKADELEIDSAARNMFEFMQLWEQGCREGLEAYKMRVGEWDLE